MTQLFQPPSFRATDANGDPVSGAKLFLFVNNTTTPLIFYSDAALTTAHPWPLVANSAGVFAPVYTDATLVKVLVTSANGSALPGYPVDNVDPAANFFTLQDAINELDTRVGSLAAGRRILGEWDASSGAFPTQRPDTSALQPGDAFIVSTGGTVDGEAFAPIEQLISLGTGGATYAGNWLRWPDDGFGSATVTATGGTTARTLADKLGDALAAPDVGTLATAVSTLGGRKVHVPAGTYPVAPLSPEAGEVTHLSGEGEDTAITLAAQGTAGPIYAIGRSDGDVDRLTIENLRFDLAVDAAATNGVNLLRWNHDDITLRGIVSSAGIEIDPSTGARNGLASISTLSAGGPCSGMSIIDCEFTDYFYGFLKANTTVSTEKDITIAFNTFAEFGSVALLFNSPAAGSLIQDVLILGNTLGANRSRQPFGGPAVGFPHRGSFAGHVEDTRLIANHAHGYGGELFRAEEAARRSVWMANTAALDGKDGIEIIPNNVGGTLYTPRYFAVIGNVLENVGLNSAPALGWGIGLQVYTTVSGLANAECLHDSVVSDNISAGWNEQLRVAQGSQRNLVHHNVLDGKNGTDSIGLRTFAPTLGIDDLLILDCATDVLATRGGMIGKLHFRSSAPVPGPAVITSSGSPLACTGWTWETGMHTIDPTDAPTSYAEYPLVPLGEMFNGRIAVSVSSGGGSEGPDQTVSYSREVMDIDWDGTTLTISNKKGKAAGGVVSSTVAPFVASGGNLVLRVVNDNATSVDRCRIQVAFDGLHVFAEPA